MGELLSELYTFNSGGVKYNMSLLSNLIDKLRSKKYIY